MAYASTSQHTRPLGFATGVSRLLSGFGRGMMRVAERQSRSTQIQELHAKSDAELARMGLSRDTIVHYVYRDLMHI